MTRIIQENKLQFFISLILVIGAFAFVVLKKDNSQAQEVKGTEKAPVTVTVQPATDSHVVDGKLKYPGLVAGDQEVKITAATSGVATAVNFDLGDTVAAGRQLVRIDDQGTTLEAGKEGFKSSQVQQAELTLEQAKESLKLAKKNYKDDKNNSTKSAREIAEIQVKNAELGLESAVNAHEITAPISGVITNRQVSIGDSVNSGQVLATISKTNLSKIQFYVNQEELNNFSPKTVVTIDDGKQQVKATVINVAPQADATTRRFLVEAAPVNKEKLLIGTVVNVWADISRAASDNSFILPLEAITVGQNENYIFLARDGKAKKVTVELDNISGETAEVKGDIPRDAEIIVEGNKLIKDGDTIVVKN